MSFATVLWFGFDFLITVVLSLFFAAVSGVGLAAGFELFRQFKSRKKDKANKDFIDDYLKQTAGFVAND